MTLFDTLGFKWDRASVPQIVPRGSIDRAVFRFRRMLPEYVWDAGVLEGNPFTFPEVKTLLEGVTVGGRKLSDQEQILNLAESSKRLIAMVTQGQFALDKPTFCELHAIVARNEALEWGYFRGEGAEVEFTPDVALGERGRFTPLHTEPGAIQLNRVFSEGLRSLAQNVSNPFERALAFHFFGALQQFFFDGNKRTSRFMMNGILMSEGIDAVSIPAVRAQEFNSKMVDFYLTRNATEMMGFLVDCHPCVAQIRQLNPNIAAVIGEANIQYTGLELAERDASDHTGVPQLENQVKEMPATSEEGKTNKLETQPFSLENVRRKAREDWRRIYRGKTNLDSESNRTDLQNSPPERAAGLEDDSDE
jgi:hypothetical protein